MWLVGCSAKYIQRPICCRTCRRGGAAGSAAPTFGKPVAARKDVIAIKLNVPKPFRESISANHKAPLRLSTLHSSHLAIGRAALTHFLSPRLLLDVCFNTLGATAAGKGGSSGSLIGPTSGSNRGGQRRIIRIISCDPHLDLCRELSCQLCSTRYSARICSA